LPSCFASAAIGEVAQAIPLIALDPATLQRYVERQPARVGRWVAAQGFVGDANTVLLLPDADGGPMAALVGVGDANDPFALASCPFALPPGTYALSKPGVHNDGLRIEMGNAMLGWGLGAYRYERYRKVVRAPARLLLEDAKAPSSEAFALLKATTLVRDMVNTPTEDMGPEELDAVARRIAKAYGGTVETIVGDALVAANFPTIHAVGRASHRAPRLIVLRWGDDAHPHVIVAGKGVCFDTGGLSIKTGDGMRNMKKDMGGAAHALGLAQLVMANHLPLRLTVLVPAVENAIAGNAFRPGEVIRTRGGISVEVDNTDAEGRLVLGDALAYAAVEAVRGLPQEQRCRHGQLGIRAPRGRDHRGVVPAALCTRRSAVGAHGCVRVERFRSPWPSCRRRGAGAARHVCAAQVPLSPPLNLASARPPA